MAQWWACDKGCGYVSGNFEETVAHEQSCKFGVQTISVIPPPQVSNAPAPQYSTVAVPAVPQVDLWRSITTMEDYIRRQQVDLAKLWDENQSLRQYLQALSLKCCQQEGELYALKSGVSQSGTIRRPIEATPQRVVPAVDTSGRSVDRARETVNHLWI
jgi:hypothetical protein